MKKIILFSLVLTILFINNLNTKTVNIASSNPGSATHSASVAIAKLIADNMKLQTRVIPHSGKSAAFLQ